MNKIKSLVCLVGAMAAASQAVAGVVFQDDFSGNSASNWTFSGQNAASWTAADQKLQSTTTATIHNPTTPGFAAINGLATTSHFKIEADVQVIGPVSAPGMGPNIDWGHVGFFWGQQSVDAFSIGYLRTHLDHVTAWEEPYSGEAPYLTGFSATNAADVNGVSYHLAFEIDYDAQTMRISLDNVSALYSGAAFTIANSAGGVGGALGVISWGERVSYDNVVVTDYTVAGVPEPGTLALALPVLLGLGFMRRRAA